MLQHEAELTILRMNLREKILTGIQNRCALLRDGGIAMWKKMLAAAVALCLCLSAAACGGSGEIDSDINRKIGKFQSYDLQGKEVNESVFARKDLTVLTVWGTFCSSYIDKLPAVVNFAEGLPENAQMILLACDVRAPESDEYSKAVTAMLRCGADFPFIITTDSLTVFVDQFENVPATILVDKKGNIVGSVFAGEDIAGYSAAAEEYLDGLK